MTPYRADDLTRAYAWLCHDNAYTEVSILHPAYRPGDKEWNRAHQAWPITWYVTTTNALLQLVAQYEGKRLLCYGLNPRPCVLRHPDGRLRSAKEPDITVCQNLVLDLDLEAP